MCRDFLSYLNHPRANTLFNPDGTLVRQSEKIISVNWETINKEAYRAGYMTIVNMDTRPHIRKAYLDNYSDPHLSYSELRRIHMSAGPQSIFLLPNGFTG